MALDTTPGGAAADSYATLTEANTYATTVRVPAVTWWSTAADGAKEAALRGAAILMDGMFDWTGGAVDSVQARAWPRNGMFTRNGFPIPTSGASSIPVELKNAQIEFALQLGASDRLSDNDALKQGITSVKAGSVAVTFADVQKTGSYESADIELRKMMADLQWAARAIPDAVRYLLVDSWYRTNSVTRPFMFGAM